MSEECCHGYKWWPFLRQWGLLKLLVKLCGGIDPVTLLGQTVTEAHQGSEEDRLTVRDFLKRDNYLHTSKSLMNVTFVAWLVSSGKKKLLNRLPNFHFSLKGRAAHKESFYWLCYRLFGLVKTGGTGSHKHIFHTKFKEEHFNSE